MNKKFPKDVKIILDDFTKFRGGYQWLQLAYKKVKK